MLRRILLLLLSCMLFCSCTADKREMVTFSSWGSITEVKILQNVISSFEKENPNIKINFIHIPQNYFQKLHLLFASNTPPDVIFVNNLYLPLYENKLEDLTDIINKQEFFSQSIEPLTIKGKLYAVPRDISNFVVYYNRDFIVTPPNNFTEFDNMLKKTTNQNHFGVSFERSVYSAAPYIMTLGFNEGLNYYKNLEGKYAPNPAQIGSSTLLQMFIDKKIVFYLSGRWMYPKLSENKNLNFGVIPFPGVGPADASGWAISKATKHKDSAKRFVKYLSSKENIDYMTTSGLIVPSRIDSAKLLDNPKERAFLEAIKYSQPRIVDKNYKKNTDKLDKEIFD